MDEAAVARVELDGVVTSGDTVDDYEYEEKRNSLPNLEEGAPVPMGGQSLEEVDVCLY